MKNKANDFKVWIPYAENVEIELNKDRVKMSRDAGGWWTYQHHEQHGLDYAFFIDGKGPYPDPRSAYQPYGVHGYSRMVDHDAFKWADENWQSPPITSAIIYELHVGTFTEQGTFKAIIDKLPYLKGIGITHIELMPLNEFSGERGWGYDGVDIYAPHHTYGGAEGLKSLINACHRDNLGVIIDFVYNHFGPEGNYLENFGPYFTDKYKTPWGKAVNYDDRHSDQVRKFIVENALMWYRDYHADGLRLDAVHAIYDQSAINILEQIACEVVKLEKQLGRHLYLTAENDLNDPRVVQDSEIGGYGFAAQWNDNFHHALHAILTNERSGYYEDFGKISDLAKCLKSVFVYDGVYSNFRQAIHGKPAQKCSGSNYVGFIQNHDQIGNRAMGERISHLCGIDGAKVAAAIVLTSPFLPLLFQGEEFAASTPFQYFSNHQDQELGKAVTQGRKREFSAFGWDPDKVPDPQAVTTFGNSKLNWTELNKEPHKGMLAWYTELIKLRKSYPELCDGSLESIKTEFSEARRYIKIQRGSILTAANFDDSEQELALDIDNYQVLLTSNANIKTGNANIILPSKSVVIIKCK